MKLLGCLLLVAAARAQNGANVDTVCRNVLNNLNCDSFPDMPICATGGMQFDTECDFAKAHCKDINIKVINEGPCPGGATSAPVTTTRASTAGSMSTAAPAPDSTTTGSQGTVTIPPDVMATTTPQLSAACQQVVTTVCGTDINVLCASDGVAYNNYCEFSKARCYLPGLQLLYTGPCALTDTFPDMTTTPTTTTTTTPTTTTAPSVFDVICRTLEQIVCQDDGVQVCASNGVTYPTACDYEKAKCQDPSLSVRTC